MAADSARLLPSMVAHVCRAQTLCNAGYAEAFSDGQVEPVDFQLVQVQV